MYLRALEDFNVTNTTNPTSSLAGADDEGIDDFEFSFVSSLVATVFILLCMREFYSRRYGVDFCPALQLFAGRSSQSQEDLDRAFAAEVQRQLDLENHEAELEAKRKDRREWYEAFVVPYTMTVEESDFFYAQETDENGNTILEGKLEPISRKYSSCSLDLEAMEEEGVNKSNDTQPSDMEDEEVDDSQLYLRLPIRDEEGHFRSVEGTCSICFSEYKVDERVVWSELRCKHAFHYDCIMPWLVKGKKRCPICRDWFVPGARIEDQKKALAERLARESTMSLSTDGSNDDNGEDGEDSLDVQGSSDDSEAQSSVCNGCVANDLENPGCQKSGACCTKLQSQCSLVKQLSSSEADDEATGSCGPYAETQESDATNSARIPGAELEAIPTNLEYPDRTPESLTASESDSSPTLDDERLSHCEITEYQEDSTASASSRLELPDSSCQPTDSIPDDQSTSQISETREMSA